MLFLIPVIRKVKASKQAVLELFLHRKIEKHIHEQMSVCRAFSLRFQTVQGGECEVGELEMPENAEDHLLQAGRRLRKGAKRKWRQLKTNVFSILTRFVVIVALVEAYYISNFLLARDFLQEVADLENGLNLLLARRPTHSFLLLLEK